MEFDRLRSGEPPDVKLHSTKFQWLCLSGEGDRWCPARQEALTLPKPVSSRNVGGVWNGMSSLLLDQVRGAVDEAARR